MKVVQTMWMKVIKKKKKKKKKKNTHFACFASLITTAG
jgi:hypothetical protein